MFKRTIKAITKPFDDIKRFFFILGIIIDVAILGYYIYLSFTDDSLRTINIALAAVSAVLLVVNIVSKGVSGKQAKRVTRKVKRGAELVRRQTKHIRQAFRLILPIYGLCVWASVGEQARAFLGAIVIVSSLVYIIVDLITLYLVTRVEKVRDGIVDDVVELTASVKQGASRALESARDRVKGGGEKLKAILPKAKKKEALPPPTSDQGESCTDVADATERSADTAPAKGAIWPFARKKKAAPEPAASIDEATADTTAKPATKAEASVDTHDEPLAPKAEATDTAPHPSLGSRLKGLLPKGRKKAETPSDEDAEAAEEPITP